MSTSDNNMRFLNRVSLDKFYRNSRNSIEDPLFTGFTLDLDTTNSPLFFALCGDEFSEYLRSVTGTNTELSKKIEEKINFAYKYHISGTPDSYEIATTYSKDMLGDNHKAGYGLQQFYYMDKPVYGAVDYIYMVDKVALGRYVDEEGVNDLGNGVDSNFYRDASVRLNDLTNKKENTVKPGFDSVIEKLNEVTTSLMNDTAEGGQIEPEEEKQLTEKEALEKKIAELKEQEDSYYADHKNTEDAYIYLKKEYDKLCAKKGGLDYSTNELNKLNTDVDNESKEINKALQEAQSEADRILNVLNSSNVNNVNTDTDKVFNEFCTFFKITSSTSVDAVITELNEPKPLDKHNVTLYPPTKSKIDSEINNRANGKAYKDSYEKLFFIKNTKLNKEVKKDTNDNINKVKSDIEKANTEVYGTHSDGRPGTKESPAENSPYKQYLDKKAECDNDNYSKTHQQLVELQYINENLKDIEEYKTSTYQTNTIKENVITPVDNTKTGGTNEPQYEVPQTVYDMMGFIKGMKDITTKYPYVLQSISGLDEAYKKYFEMKDPYMGSGDEKISIECLEFLDLRVSSMLNKYFNAVYDRQYRRERVPINLRRFNCSIFVHDIRNFKNSLNYDPDSDVSKIVEMALNYVSAVEFKFYDCEIVPEETGNIFEEVSNLPSDDMRKTHFTFTYGNCVINFLPFEDLRKYLLNKDVENIQPKQFTDVLDSSNQEFTSYADEGVDDGNFRRWYDKSELGNVNNNDYRDYVRHDSSVAVDDMYKTTIVNNFALNSVVNKNQQLTDMDDALRRIVVGISASTGVPVRGVTDALNIQFIDPILNERDLATPVLQKIGNVHNSKVIDVDTMEYIGEVIGDEDKTKVKFIDFLGNVNEKKDGK